MRKILLISTIIIVAFEACTSRTKVADVNLSLFTAEKINYQPTLYDDQMLSPDTNGVYHLMSGKLLMKQIKLPIYKGKVSAKVSLTLLSEGEKPGIRGELFFISNAAQIDFVNIVDSYDMPTVPEQLESLLGLKSSPKFTPLILMSAFVTPLDADSQATVADPRWETKMVIMQDMSAIYQNYNHEDGIWVGLWLDTKSAEGYLVDMSVFVKHVK